ncbi:S8 family serine peptidase [Lysobacter humi (ex Lee et al. 2017)]
MHRLRVLLTAFLAVATVAGAASAQVLGVPGLPSLPDLARPVAGVVEGAANAPLIRAPLDSLRHAQVRELLRREPLRIALDPLGEPVLRGEFLATGADDAALDAIRAAGFDVLRAADEGAALGIDLHVLRDTRRRDPGRAMRALQQAAPAVEFAYQHVFLPAGTPSAQPAAPQSAVELRIGLVDGGVDARSVPGMRVERFGCDGRAVPQPHGTSVAARLGAQARGTLFAADLWCGERVGRATLGLVEALGWMARERVAVVNVSLVGPHNPVLARAVQAMVERGHVIVAAVGNDGPAAPPLYPAAYPGVVGVSGVDAKLRVLPEAASGPQVDFSAPGVVGPRQRGTSFAAPVVARAIAARLREPSPVRARDVQRELAAQARDLGAPGRDARYGEGLIATAF